MVGSCSWVEYQQADMLLPDTGTRPDTSSGGGVGVVVWWHIVGLSINKLRWLVSWGTDASIVVGVWCWWVVVCQLHSGREHL